MDLQIFSSICSISQIVGLFALHVLLNFKIKNQAILWIVVGVGGSAAFAKCFFPLAGHQSVLALCAGVAGFILAIISCHQIWKSLAVSLSA